MKIFEAVKSLPSISLFLVSLMANSPAMAAQPELKGPLFQLECGIYTIRGTITQDKQGRFLLTLNPGSSSPFEFILLGGAILDKTKHLTSESSVRVYVPQPIRTPERPFVFLQSFIAQSKAEGATVVLEKKEACGKQERFLEPK